MGAISRDLICAIEAATVDVQPCNNIYLPSVMGSATYGQLLQSMPTADLYLDIDHPDAVDETGQITRKLLDLTPATIAKMPQDIREFWSEFYHEVTSVEVTSALFKKLGVEHLDVVPVPVFYKDYEGFKIGIHTDAPYKVATLQLYLPRDEEIAEFGTCFHMRDGQNFRLLKRNRFLPGAAYAFLRSEESWHSVDQLPLLSTPRDSLAITYYLPGYEYSSAPDYVAPEKRVFSPAPITRDGQIIENIHSLGVGAIRQMSVDGKPLRFLTQGSGWRFETLMQKEPETINWIRCFQKGDLFWDIGANCGIYTLFAALTGARVTAFEPHFANYFQLCANIYLNEFASDIVPICMSFSKDSKIERLNMTSINFGTSMSSFGNTLDFRGTPFKPEFSQGMIGMGIDVFIETFGVETPNHIKIDVDGLELEIIESAKLTLANPLLYSVQVELIESDATQVEMVTEIMQEAGFQLIYKVNNPAFCTPETVDVKNFLFVKAR